MKEKNRPIPGTTRSHDRDFLYVQVEQKESFGDLIEKVFANTPSIPLPASGGVVEENVKVTTKKGLTLLGISYRGDKDGWRNKIQGFCAQEGRKYGLPHADRLSFPEGEEVLFADCKVEFDRY